MSWFGSVMYIFMLVTNGCPRMRITSPKSGGAQPDGGVRARSRACVVVVFFYICLPGATQARLANLCITRGATFKLPLQYLGDLEPFPGLRENNPSTTFDAPRKLHRRERGSSTSS